MSETMSLSACYMLEHALMGLTSKVIYAFHITYKTNCAGKSNCAGKTVPTMELDMCWPDITTACCPNDISPMIAVARTLQLGCVLGINTVKAEVHRVLAQARHSSRQTFLAGSSRARQQQVQVPLAVYMNDELLSVLMEWVQAVCKVYNVTVHNFTSCFGDGVVLCLLVRRRSAGTHVGACMLAYDTAVPCLLAFPHLQYSTSMEPCAALGVRQALYD